MARIRSLKIGFFQNETLAELSFAHRLLFEGLWLIADREGRLEDRPKRIKGQIFPYDDGLNVDAMLTDLAAGADPFIVRYEVNGQRYIQVAGFVTHQRPHHTEPASVYPTVDQGVATTPDKTGGAPDSHRPTPLGMGSGSGNGERDLGKGTGKDVAPARLPAPLIDGRTIRAHGEHAECFLAKGRPNLCITRYLHDVCMGAIGGPVETRDERVRAIYLTAIDELGDAPCGENPLDFWRNVIAAKVPAATARAPSSVRGSRTGDSMDAAKEYLSERFEEISAEGHDDADRVLESGSGREGDDGVSPVGRSTSGKTVERGFRRVR